MGIIHAYIRVLIINVLIQHIQDNAVQVNRWLESKSSAVVKHQRTYICVVSKTTSVIEWFF